MKIIGLDQKEYSLNLVKYNKPRENCSILHSRARILLHNLFPYDIIFEEIVLPGIKSEISIRPLILDFYINSQKLAVEVQGQQHYDHVKFFYGNKLEFFRARRLDSLKKQWCDINNIRLVELPFDKTDNEWTNLIRIQ